MDPEITYQQIIDWAQQISDGEDQLGDDEFTDLLYDLGPGLAEQVLFLDAWLRKDGFPPEAWENSLRRAGVRRAGAKHGARQAAPRNIAGDPAERAHEALTLIHDVRAEAMMRGNSEVVQAARDATDQIKYLIELLR